ncbi:hypothetical protein [Maritimibacter fusiformis]|uniref:Uncharacterized protein n=1 Tax=Maritimibacter fusiformis TaxID=2603819 RepID=A0A5D0RIB4_9RHOB|nr:hypothetical protein [Maritimibacter fusiformis]TYB80671.1 hypothetical protein FVF75_13660 [Maritimibacter fusiformis]
MSKVFNRFTDNRLDSAAIDWLVFATGVVVLTVSIAASVAAPAYGRMSDDAARRGLQTEVTPS